MLLYSNPKSPFCLCSLFLKCSASAETKGSKVCVGIQYTQRFRESIMLSSRKSTEATDHGLLSGLETAL